MSVSSLFFSRKYNCPVCRTEFTTLAVRSSMVYVEKRESDLHTLYKGISPLHYSMVVCPSCNYAASHKIFVQELPASIANQLGTALFKLKENIEFDLCSERNINAALYSFKLAVRSAQLKKVAEGELAGLLLATAWIAREAAEKELESYYLEEALHSYLKAYEEGLGTIGNLDDLQAAYLIGELNLRTGNYREAVNWFNQVIIHKNLKTHPAEEKMAREQWALARELGRQNYNPVSDDSKVVEDQTLLIQTQPEAPHTTEPPNIKRTCMQMSVNFYSDQIDWLARIVNNGYNHSKKLITKEQVVRSIIDALIELMGDTMPDHFSTEAELKQNIINMLDR